MTTDPFPPPPLLLSVYRSRQVAQCPLAGRFEVVDRLEIEDLLLAVRGQQVKLLPPRRVGQQRHSAGRTLNQRPKFSTQPTQD